MSQNDGDPVVGDGSLARRSPAKFAKDAAASVAGFAVALGCTHRGAPASVMLEPLAVYPGVACEFPGGPDECTPGECPLVRIAVERVYGVVSTQLAEGASRAAGKLWRRFFGGGQPPSGAG